METSSNIVIEGKHNKPILLDLHFKSDGKIKPVIIFCHGYKGFKNWGAWDLLGDCFEKEGFLFIKFNFSHNGGTIETPIDFPDLDAFGNNNYTKELDDLASVIDWVHDSNNYIRINANLNNITLMGHSRGGGIVSIKAQEDSRIKNIISLAGVSDFKSRFPRDEDLKKWQKTGVYHVKNGRTKQNMPHYYQFYKDFVLNENRLTISNAVKKLKIPHLIIHGDNDTSVSIKEAYALNKWNSKSILTIIEDANHVFGTNHPWNKNVISNHLKQVLNKTIWFLKNSID